MTGKKIQDWLEQAATTIRAVDPEAVTKAADALERVRAREGTIFIAGNGGSASTASHLALDLQKAVRGPTRTTRALALSDSIGLITAWANDTAYDRVFSEQLRVLARRGDALVIISVSGSSPNLIAAIAAAKEMGLVTVALLGGAAGPAATSVDFAIVVPSHDYGWVESAHVVLHHIITYALRDAEAGS